MSTPANIIYSNINDPYINLGIENWIFKNLINQEPILFLWQSSPAIIIGRAQNPWLECNLAETKKDSIPIVRRQSGGGTVFHDLGNINFTFLMPNHLYNKKKHLKVIVSALQTLGIKTEINDRNDIISKANGQPYKLSGSAYRETKHTSFHHGTLLINSDLSSLVKYLHHKIDENITAKGVSSVRSKVTSIKEISPESASVKLILSKIEESFKKHYKVSHPKAITIDENFVFNTPSINDYANSIKNWDWIYSKTLPFEYKIQIYNSENILLHIKQGKVVHCDNIPEIQEFQNIWKFINQQPLLKSESLKNLDLMLMSNQEKILFHQIMHLFS